MPRSVYSYIASSAVLLLAGSLLIPAQNTPANNNANSANLDPIAMHALKSMSEQLQRATSFSFKARIMREEPGTDGQMLDFFRDVTVQVQRPDKMRMQVISDTSDLTLWYDGKNITVMPVSARIYSVVPSPGTVDTAIQTMRDKMDVHTPLYPFLSSDANQRLSEGLESANEIGFVRVGNEQWLHLAFTEADANWQLWLSGPNQVVPRRMSIVYKNIEGQPRVNVDFTDWDLQAEIPNTAFVFMKPEGAVEETWNALRPRTTAPAEKKTGGER